MKPKKQKNMTLLTVLMFILNLLFASLSRFLRAKSQEVPTLQEIMMGEKIPMSDSYYIPDDKIQPSK